MRIFKNKTLGRVLSFLSIVLLIIGMDRGLGYLLAPITYATYFSHDVRELEKTGENADVVFIGASRINETFDTRVFTDEWGVKCVLNAGSAGQSVRSTYYQLKDLVERIHPDRVYIEAIIDGVLSEKEDPLKWRLEILDRLSPKNKILMVLDCFEPEEAIYLLQTYRHNENLDIENIRTNLREKTALRKTGERLRTDRLEYYAGNGFTYNRYSCAPGTIPIMGAVEFSPDKVSEDKLKYLDACIKLCKDNNIEVNLVTGVTSVMRMYACTGYQEANDFYKSYAEANGIKYYNLNYMKERESLLPDDKMYDYNHCNGEGAHIASEFFAQIVKKEEAGEDVSQYFYRDLDDFKKSVKRIVAVGAEISEGERENTVHISIESLHNDDVTPLYRVLICGEDENEYSAAQDWTRESELEIELGDAPSYMIKVEAGAEDRFYGTASQEYTYEK